MIPKGLLIKPMQTHFTFWNLFPRSHALTANLLCDHNFAVNFHVQQHDVPDVEIVVEQILFEAVSIPVEQIPFEEDVKIQFEGADILHDVGTTVPLDMVVVYELLC